MKTPTWLCPRCNTDQQMQLAGETMRWACAKCGTTWNDDYLRGWNHGAKAMRERLLNYEQFGGLLDGVEKMSTEDELYVRQGYCPRCIQQEGRPEAMRLLGIFGPIRGHQCVRCKNVWVISTLIQKAKL